MLCEIRILTKVSLPCTVQCKPKQDHARGNRPWCQSLQALCAPVVCFPQGWVYQIAQALAKSPWLQSSCPPPSCTSIATIFIAKKLCASAGQSPGVWRLSHSSIHVRFRPWEMAHRNEMVLLASMAKFVLLCCCKGCKKSAENTAATSQETSNNGHGSPSLESGDTYLAGLCHLKIYTKLFGKTSRWWWIHKPVFRGLKTLHSSLLFVLATSMKQQDFIAQ